MRLATKAQPFRSLIAPVLRVSTTAVSRWWANCSKSKAITARMASRAYPDADTQGKRSSPVQPVCRDRKVDPHISRQRTVGSDLYGKLEPALILSKAQRTLLFIEGCRLCHAVVGPALKAGHLRQIAIMAERRQIFRSEPRSSRRGVVRGNFISSLLLNETGNGGAILTCAASTQPSHFLVNLI